MDSTVPKLAETRAEAEHQPGMGQDGDGGHDDGDLQQDLGVIEVRVLVAVDIPLVFQVLGFLLDFFLLGAVARLFLSRLLQQFLVTLPDLRLERLLFQQVQFQPQLLAPVEMLPDVLGLVEGPLVRGLLLGQEHLLHGVVAPQGGDGQEHRKDGGGEGHVPGKGLALDLFQFFRVGEFHLRHGNVLSQLELLENRSGNRYCLEKGQLAREKGAPAAILILILGKTILSFKQPPWRP